MAAFKGLNCIIIMLNHEISNSRLTVKLGAKIENILKGVVGVGGMTLR